MHILEILLKKRNGFGLSRDEIRFAIDRYTDGEIPDYQMSALLMACFINGMDEVETRALTEAMLHSGDVLDLSDIPGRKVDKHSTGGVGDKTSLILGPIAAAAGVRVPMISGRGLGHTGGTLDKLEAIPGLRVNLTEAEFRRGIEEIGFCLIGQTSRIAPADRKIYALRDVTATVDSIPLIVASIMSKKLAEGLDALVLDVKTGRGAFMKTLADSRRLAKALVSAGNSMGKKTIALITEMSQPLGTLVGNALEVEESIRTLRGEGPADLTELSLELAAEMILLAGLANDLPEARRVAGAQITSGRALEIMRRQVAFQGGDPAVVDDPGRLPAAPYSAAVKAARAGHVQSIDAERIGMAVVHLGGGRLTKEDVIDPAVGVRLIRKVGSPVEAGEPLAEVYYTGADRLARALPLVESAFQVGAGLTGPPPLIHQRIE